jgi:uncharacterized membrane protein YoaK (UPF0700 family)
VTAPRTNTLSRRHEPLLLLLTIGAASTDALSYLGLGRVFPANMTGNTVLLAIGTAGAKYEDAIRSTIALGGFLVGAVLAGLATGGHAVHRWTAAIRAVLLAELAVQLAVLGWWLTLPDKPHGAPQLALIGMLGVTMGAQSGVVARLPAGVSTTYITGTWTAVSTWAAGWLRPGRGPDPEQQAGLQASVLACYLAAAFGGGYLFIYAGPVVAAIPPGAVTVVSLALCRPANRREW